MVDLMAGGEGGRRPSTSSLLLFGCAERMEWDKVKDMTRRENDLLRTADKNRDGWTLAHYAAVQNNVSALTWLKDEGAPLRQRSLQNRTPLHEAMRIHQGRIEVSPKRGSGGTRDLKDAIEFLLQNAYTAAERLYYGEGLTEGEADAQQRVQTMEREFTAHPDEVNSMIEDLELPWIVYCTQERRLPDLKWLVAHGGDIAHRDNSGHTLLHLLFYAEEDLDTELDDLIPENDGDQQQQQQGAGGDPEARKARRHQPDAAEASASASASASGSGGREASSGIASPGNVLEFLIEATQGDLVDARNTDGETPAMVCADRVLDPSLALDLLKILHKAGADMKALSADGVTVPMRLAQSFGDGPWLEWAFKRPPEGPGCDREAKDFKGNDLSYYLAVYAENEMESLSSGDEDDDDDDDDI